jgi:hypothetical protein
MASPPRNSNSQVGLLDAVNDINVALELFWENHEHLKTNNSLTFAGLAVDENNKLTSVTTTWRLTELYRQLVVLRESYYGPVASRIQMRKQRRFMQLAYTTAECTTNATYASWESDIHAGVWWGDDFADDTPIDTSTSRPTTPTAIPTEVIFDNTRRNRIKRHGLNAQQLVNLALPSTPTKGTASRPNKTFVEQANDTQADALDYPESGDGSNYSTGDSYISGVNTAFQSNESNIDESSVEESLILDTIDYAAVVNIDALTVQLNETLVVAPAPVTLAGELYATFLADTTSIKEGDAEITMIYTDSRTTTTAQASAEYKNKSPMAPFSLDLKYGDHTHNRIKTTIIHILARHPDWLLARSGINRGKHAFIMFEFKLKGYDREIPSYDLNDTNISTLNAASPRLWYVVEYLVYQRIRDVYNNSIPLIDMNALKQMTAAIENVTLITNPLVTATIITYFPKIAFAIRVFSKHIDYPVADDPVDDDADDTENNTVVEITEPMLPKIMRWWKTWIMRFYSPSTDWIRRRDISINPIVKSISQYSKNLTVRFGKQLVSIVDDVGMHTLDLAVRHTLTQPDAVQHIPTYNIEPNSIESSVDENIAHKPDAVKNTSTKPTNNMQPTFFETLKRTDEKRILINYQLKMLNELKKLPTTNKHAMHQFQKILGTMSPQDAAYLQDLKFLVGARGLQGIIDTKKSMLAELNSVLKDNDLLIYKRMVDVVRAIIVAEKTLATAYLQHNFDGNATELELLSAISQRLNDAALAADVAQTDFNLTFTALNDALTAYNLDTSNVVAATTLNNARIAKMSALNHYRRLGAIATMHARKFLTTQTKLNAMLDRLNIDPDVQLLRKGIRDSVNAAIDEIQMYNISSE